MIMVDPQISTIPLHVRSGPEADYKTTVALMAIAVYSLYRTLGSVRHGTVARQGADDAFGQHAKEAVRGHKKAAAVVFACKVRPREE